MEKDRFGGSREMWPILILYVHSTLMIPSNQLYAWS
jgi:hypothetical protein